MNAITYQPAQTHYRSLTEAGAKKLADLYLPVHLRDFFLHMHGIAQYELYAISSCPEEFFTLIQQEQARIQKLYQRPIYRHMKGLEPEDILELRFERSMQIGHTPLTP
jgi:hypothetical protein